MGEARGAEGGGQARSEEGGGDSHSGAPMCAAGREVHWSGLLPLKEHSVALANDGEGVPATRGVGILQWGGGGEDSGARGDIQKEQSAGGKLRRRHRGGRFLLKAGRGESTLLGVLGVEDPDQISRRVWFLLKLEFITESQMGLGEDSDPRLFVIPHLDEGKGSLGVLREEGLTPTYGPPPPLCRGRVRGWLAVWGARPSLRLAGEGLAQGLGVVRHRCPRGCFGSVTPPCHRAPMGLTPHTSS